MGRRSGGQELTCAYCAEEATKVMELYVSERAARGSGRNRGTRLQSVTRRVCDRHAKMYFAAVQMGPAGQPPVRPMRKIEF